MISVYLNGRLGNNIFQYIFCRISSLKNECNFFIPKSIDESISFYRFCIQKFNHYLEMPCDTNPHYWTGDKLFDINFGSNDGFLNKIVGDTNINNVKDGDFLVDFYQSEYYMLEYRDTILNDWLKFTDYIENESKILLEKYNVNNYCFIHYRGTDYKSIPQYYLPLSYYLNSIEYVKSLHPNLNFVIITDDIDESKKLFPNYESISNSSEIDFYLLSQSKYKIIPNSSFSWWASWLSKNNIVTIAPNKWFNYNDSNKDYFSPNGIKSSFFTYL